MMDILRVENNRVAPTEPAEAVAHWRALSREHLGKFDRQLATSLVTYAHSQAVRGDTVGALATAREALDLWRRLDEASHSFEPSLGNILYAVSVYLAKLGNVELARSVAEDAVRFWRKACTVDPGKRVQLAGALQLLSTRCWTITWTEGLFALKIETGGTNDAAPPVELMALALSTGGETALILSSFSSMFSNTRRDVLVHLPRGFGIRSSSRLRVISYRAPDCVFSAIRTDLANSGNLKPVFADHPLCLGEPIDMAVNAQRARIMLRENWPRYKQVMKDGLKWRAGGSRIRLTGDVLGTSLECNELLVIEGFSH